MNVLVINGSPRGDKSVSLQTMKYLEIVYPEDHFEFINVSAKIAYYETHIEEISNLINESDIIVFSYPVYTFMAPSQLHRFIAAMKKTNFYFNNKYCTQFTTSKHFYDITAHNYIEENCNDLGFKYLPGLSSDMEDLPTKDGQKQAVNFWRHIHWLIDEMPLPDSELTRDYSISIVTDSKDEDISLNQMINELINIFPGKSKVLNLNDFSFQGGCLGCLRCAASGKCFYTDGFDTFLREEVQKSDAIIYAFTIKDHSMGTLFKQYDDRQFCNGHRTITMGQPVGYLISGEYSKENNLQMILNARAQVGGNYLAGVSCDENDMVTSVNNLNKELLFALNNSYLPPKNFYGVGGMKIFRDLIYQMQGLMKQDHRFFKSHGQYDFPQKKKGVILGMYLVGLMFSNPKIMKKMSSKFDEGMMSSYKKVLDEAKNNNM